MAEVDAVMARLTESGELVGGEALTEARRTRGPSASRRGSRLVTDGPLAEAKTWRLPHGRVRDDGPRSGDRSRLAQHEVRPE